MHQQQQQQQQQKNDENTSIFFFFFLHEWMRYLAVSTYPPRDVETVQIVLHNFHANERAQ